MRPICSLTPASRALRTLLSLIAWKDFPQLDSWRPKPAEPAGAVARAESREQYQELGFLSVGFWRLGVLDFGELSFPETLCT